MKTEDIDKKIGMPDVNDEWAKFESEVINKEEPAPKKSRRPLYIWLGGLGIAASLLLLLMMNMKDPQAIEDAPMIAQVQKPLKAEPVKEVQEVQPEEQEVQPIAQARPIKKEMQSIGTSVDMSEFEDLAITEVDEALQGRVAGLDVVENAGNLGSGNSVRLRGTGTMSSDGDNSPLIVVNGEILHLKLDDEVWSHATKDDFPQILDLENQTVESIRVLKGASAVAVYGSQGGNGVIEITSKPKIQSLPDSLIAKVKAYEKKSDPNILVGRNHGKIDMSKFEGLEGLTKEQLQGRIAGLKIVPNSSEIVLHPTSQRSEKGVSDVKIIGSDSIGNYLLMLNYEEGRKLAERLQIPIDSASESWKEKMIAFHSDNSLPSKTQTCRISCSNSSIR